MKKMLSVMLCMLLLAMPVASSASSFNYGTSTAGFFLEDALECQ